MHHPARNLAATLLALALFAAAGRAADDKKYDTPSAPLVPEVWRTTAKSPLQPGEIDRLLDRELRGAGVTPAPRTTDEQFIRRLSLDLTGRPPTPEQVSNFVANKAPDKRARLIDRLLDSDAYARQQARYWREVLLARATATQVFLRLARAPALERWLYEQFKANRPWAEIARALVTAEGGLDYGNPDKANGAAAFLLCHIGPGAADERAADTARIFLGIQLQCAQCHNHPTDVWKRDQFHELAAFYGRTRERLRRDGMMVNVSLGSSFVGEHRMPDLNRPGRSTLKNPRFLAGAALPEGRPDEARRQALADALTSRDNYWFAAAYVNRLWGELLGQSFYQPVDDMGPLKEAHFPAVLARLAAGLQASDYDTKQIARAVLNSAAYQRQVRLGKATDEHLQFAAAYPARLKAEALWASLAQALGPLEPPRPMMRRPGPMAGPLARFRTFQF
ncbi:MAG TPA: DUF1549 domain-containing protein, partial [Gemmataceae bacterium]|nr:DUF1549 domain-containing protein [Gemmataceae bacterium]